MARMALAIHEELRKRLRAPTRARVAKPAPPAGAPTKAAIAPAKPAAATAVDAAVDAAVAPTATALVGAAAAAEPPLHRKPAPASASRRALAAPEWRFDPRRVARPRGPAVDFNACCGDPEPEAESVVEPPVAQAPVEAAVEAAAEVQTGAPVALPETLEVTLPTPDVRVPLSAEESYLKDWYDESTKECAEEHIWVAADKEDVSTVSFTEERLDEIGIPIRSSARLFWIQDKPEEFADRFGHWDPVGARWRILTKHSVVPVEQRIAPVGVGYGATQTGDHCCETDSFVSHEYEETQDTYKSTALHSGLAYISAQLNALPRGTPIPVASGWGCDAAGKSSYYTPHLRHVSIDDAISEEDGKRYVYHPGIGSDREPVKPMLVEASWSSANACWAISGASSEVLGRDERAADALLGRT